MPEQGVIKWYNDEKGYGFIVSDAGTDVFLHNTAIDRNSKQGIREGARVSFDVEKGPKGLQAANVHVTGDR